MIAATSGWRGHGREGTTSIILAVRREWNGVVEHVSRLTDGGIGLMLYAI